MATLLTLLLVAVAAIGCQADISLTDAALADMIPSGGLPGLTDSISFRQFAGYLTFNSTNNRKIFYWFVESQNDPTTDPILLWTNGGPGCSGLIGFFEEHGPFSPQEGGTTLALNPHSWNYVANMLYIEAPAGVGFSYSDVTADYTVGDARTAADNYELMLQFLERFPTLATNKFYITSESYGGHYMPTLAQTIVEGNSAGLNTQINFGGFAVGNPYTDLTENLWGVYFTEHGHSLLPPNIWSAINTACFEDGGSIWSTACSDATAQADALTQDLDPYAIDYPTCSSGAEMQKHKLRSHLPHYRQRMQTRKASLAKKPKLAEMLLSMQSAQQKKQSKAKSISKSSSKASAMSIKSASSTSTTGTAVIAEYSYDPCRENYATTYLNLASVQTALHVVPTTWEACTTSSLFDYSIDDSNSPMEPYYVKLMAVQKELGLNFLVFSGDDDTVCGTAGTVNWMWNLFNVTEAWAPWLDSNDQVAGYVTKFDGITFATVHSAGHLVPSEKPKRAMQLLRNYLSGKW